MEFLFGIKNSTIEKAFTVWKKTPEVFRRPMINIFHRYAKARLARLRGPVRLILFVTNRCNRNCRHCFYSSRLNSNISDELSLSEIEAMTRSFPEPLKVVTITGGEPFCRSDLPDIIALISRKCKNVKISISTNGDLPQQSESALRNIMTECAVTLNLQVSIQKPSDLDPGSNSAETLNRFITLRKEFSGIGQVAALTTVGKENVHYLSELGDILWSQWKVLHKVQFLRNIPDCVFASDPESLSDLTPQGSQAQMLSVEEEKGVIEWARAKMYGTEYSLMNRQQLAEMEIAAEVREKQKSLFQCQAGWVDAVVFEDGRVSICENRKPFASLREFDMNFSALWNSHFAAQARKNIRSCACTHPCNITTSMSYDIKSLKKVLLP